MAKWVHSDVLDGGLNALKAGAIRVSLVKNYTAGDSYATALASSNVIATATLADGEWTLAPSGSSRKVTPPTKTVTATGSYTSGSGNTHLVYHDGSAKIYWVTDETGDASVAAGDTVVFPAGIDYTANQPT